MQAVNYGKVELPEGISATPNIVIAGFISAEVHSPVTGGSDQETDAELMLRCQYNTADAGIGSYNGLRRKLNNAPVAVSGFSVVAGDDVPMMR